MDSTEITIFGHNYNVRLTLDIIAQFETYFAKSFITFSNELAKGNLPGIAEMWFMVKACCIKAGGKAAILDKQFESAGVGEMNAVIEAFTTIIAASTVDDDAVGNSVGHQAANGKYT